MAESQPQAAAQCPNNCGELVSEHQNLEDHITTSCPLTVVNCDFQYFGCKARLPRKHMPPHLSSELAYHSSLLATSHRKQQDEIRDLKNKISDLQNDSVQLKKFLRPYNYPPCNITIDLNKALPERKLTKEGDREMVATMVYSAPEISTSFYSHYFGYRFNVVVKKSQALMGLLWDCVYVSIALEKGEDDVVLTWPVSCSIRAQILSQIDQDHYTINVRFNREIPRAESKQIEFDGPKFNKKYVKNDRVEFRILNVNLC